MLAMAQFGPILFRTVLALPPIILVAMAAPRFFSGIAIDAAFPVPARMEMNVPLDLAQYQRAAKALAYANAADGDAWILRAEATSFAGEGGAGAMLQEGLRRNPSSARGWMLFVEATADAPERARALEFLLGKFPYEYWIAGRKVSAGATLWNDVSEEARAAILAEGRRLWTEPTLHEQLWPVLTTDGGPELLTRAFADDPDSLRELNRWVALRRWRFSWGG
jgi:hypothetical protein